jgi:ATP-dependent exoDNAse (exonuclease V) beta subunit
MSPVHRTVVSAAAGTGKTTRLVQEYLDLLGRYPPSRIVAITFTRKAAAELVERVTWSLRAAGNDPKVPEEFKGEFESLYRQHVPGDPERVKQALAELPNAPVGTTDSFVLGLLNEFALHARLPGVVGAGGYLDLPIAVGDSKAAFEAAVREVVDAPDGSVPEEAGTLLDRLTLAELIEHVTALAAEPDDWDTIPLATLVRPLCERAAAVFLETYAGNPPLVEKDTTTDGRPYVQAVHTWMAEGARPKDAPPELLGWSASRLKGDQKKKEPPQFLIAFKGLSLDLGSASLPFLGLLKTCRRGRYLSRTLEAAESMRARLLELARRARPLALARAAAEGALDHGMLTDVAIALCEDPPPRLKARFDALLVDEAQDSSPQQFRLFRALEGLPGDCRPFESFYVGDVRQSIYLFRGAEPREFSYLMEQTQAQGGVEALEVNFRSSESLVAAQRALFAVAGLPGVDSLTGLKHAATASAKELPPDLGPVGAKPVWLVAQALGADKGWNSFQANATGLDVFAERLQAIWTQPGRGDDTAAVLTSSWRKAWLACERLRSLLGGSDKAFVDGADEELLNGRVARDLRLLVRALWDRTDDIAWVGVWKHPMVNLTDGALALLKEGIGVRFDGERHGYGLSGAADASSLDPGAFPTADVEAFARVNPVLSRACRGIGREPTADVLDRLAADLHWRAILLAGPDGLDGAAQLEVLLDWIRQAEADGVDPSAVIDLLDPEGGEEAPRLTLHRPAGSVSCTTVHQAKGLQYDHVYVYDIGTSREGASNQGWPRARVELGGVSGTLVGVKFDPLGALEPAMDLVGRVADAVWEARKDEERLRMAYVAITRARRSVTFPLYGPGRGIHDALAAAWVGSASEDPGLTGVHVEEREGPRDIVSAVCGHARAVAPFSVARAEPRGWSVVPPSGAWEQWDAQARAALVKRVAETAEFLPGGDPLAPPDAPEAVWQAFGAPGEDAFWGTVAHGWFAASRLAAAPSTEAARAYIDGLDLAPGLDQAAAAQWLVDLSANLARQRADLLAQLASPDATLRFEHPFVGVDETDPADRRLHAGRMDLLVTWPGQRAWVIDFKVGEHGPTARETLAGGANLRQYAPQLEAYRRSLERMGWKVEKVGLLFGRTGAWVGW